jgi:small subunit ribosomal protein S4
MRIGPKYKIARRLGAEVFEKTQTQKFQLNEEKRAKSRKRRRGSRSDYARQLLDKQKVRVTYGLTERQFRKYVNTAMAEKQTPTTDSLYKQLETRLDNIVYRLGIAPTRASARQLVSHGHIDVNGRRITVPSFSAQKGDSISIRQRSVEKVPFQEMEERVKGVQAPNWLSFDAKKKEGEVVAEPQLDGKDHNLNLSSVIEFYSR